MAIDPDAEKKGFEPGSATRITLVGRLLRKTKIDELPQLLNVIRGEMSIVGPRPEVKCYIELYPERWSKILEVSPGITDPASVIFRNEEEILKRAEDPEEKYRLEILPGKLKLYEKYVDDITFRKDFGIIIDTIKALFSVR
jgi:lipopolysaccharide/colanic/teichoic acid biosynthesis glycosyltransferase